MRPAARLEFFFAVMTPISKTRFRICFFSSAPPDKWRICARHQQKSFFPAHSFSSSKRAAANTPWNLPFPFHLALTERCSSCCRWLTQLLQGLVDDLFCGADLRARGGKHKRSTHLCVCIWIISADKHRPWRKQELASVCPFGPHGGIILGVLTQNDTSLILLPVLVVCEV